MTIQDKSIPTAPNYVMPLKEALVFAGLLAKEKAGRGKPSKEMVSNAEMLVAEHGYQIKNFTVSKPVHTGVQKESNVPVVVRRTTTPVKQEYGEVTFTYPEAEWEAFAELNGKKISVSMREVCANCYTMHRIHISLTGHLCLAPSVRTVDLKSTDPTPVKIVPRKTPLPNKRW